MVNCMCVKVVGDKSGGEGDINFLSPILDAGFEKNIW